MKPGKATGAQLAFFTFAVLLLAAPLSAALGDLLPVSAEGRRIVAYAMPFAVTLVFFGAFPALRRFARAELARPVPATRKGEVAIVAVASWSIAFATFGAIALWSWWTGGAEGLERRIAREMAAEAQLAFAYSPAGMFRALVIGAVVAPVVEELVFRGLVYRALEERWGWPAAMLATSALFGVYHPYFLAAFASSIVYVCVLRRTGTLRASMLVHAVYNLGVWYPYLGRYLLAPEGPGRGDPASWAPQIACLGFAAATIPVYVWMARASERGEPPARAA